MGRKTLTSEEEERRNIAEARHGFDEERAGIIKQMAGRLAHEKWSGPGPMQQAVRASLLRKEREGLDIDMVLETIHLAASICKKRHDALEEFAVEIADEVATGEIFPERA
jgi:hypothetical protein